MKNIDNQLYYWTHMLDEAFCKDLNNNLLLEWQTWNYDTLHGIEWEDVLAQSKKSPPPKEMWEAAQFNPPDEDTHGKLGACTIVNSTYRKYLKNYFVIGQFHDGTSFKLDVGPNRRVGSFYMLLHRLSANAKAWDEMADDNFSSITIQGDFPPEGEICRIIKTGIPSGFYVATNDSSFRAGPFDNKQLARTYALVKNITLSKGSRDSEEKGTHITYPTFVFTYTLNGIECMDIVNAETIQLAMKRFNFQWHVFFNRPPIVETFNNLKELSSELKWFGIKNINMFEITSDEDRVEYAQIAKKIGNPSTNPRLMKLCKNPRFRYLLGIDQNKGRSTVKINY